MKKCLTLLLAALVATVCMLPAWAANVVYVSLPVTVRASGDQPDVPEMVAIVLTAEDESAPMPVGADNGVYTMSMQVGSQSAFPDIAYTEPGNYFYTVRQEPGSTGDCVYDAICYAVEVCIAPGDDGIYPVIVVQEFGSSIKLDGIVFLNAYPVVTPTPVPTRPPSDLPATGVEDYWMFYLGGAAACLLLAAFMLRILLRPEEANAADGGNPFRRDDDE
ncbi:MAG: hypothetical protein IKK57_01270 [Clostridia bacterium]|nr:hypothetical protein [Clostridia bacterium]